MEKCATRVAQIAVRVLARDVVSSAGLGTILRGHPQIELASANGPADVTLYTATHVNPDDLRRLRGLPADGGPIVLFADSVNEASLLALIDCGVVGIVIRSTASDIDLCDAALAAAHNHGVMSSELLGKLLGLVRTMQQETLGPLGVNSVGFTDREVEVLRMLADGAETAEIARRLTYSESTIKHILHTLTTRFKFRNRVQAVAYAFRAGVL